MVAFPITTVICLPMDERSPGVQVLGKTWVLIAGCTQPACVCFVLQEGTEVGLKVNGEPKIPKMDILKNGMPGGVKALPGGGLGEDSRIFACTDEPDSLKKLVRAMAQR